MEMMTLLLVDDEYLTRKALIDGVDWAALGIGRILEAGGGTAAREIIENEPVDLALVDIEMPDETGLELLEWVRHESSHKDLPCAFLTCHASFDYAQQALRLRCSDYLLKPMVYEEVEKLIRKMIGASIETQKQRENQAYGRQWIREREEDARQYEKEAFDTKAMVEEIVVYIRGHLSEKLTLTDLAARACLNQNYFNKVFKQHTGETVNKFIIRERMTLAARLLTERNLKSYAIAEMLGYDNYANFVNMFKKTYGVSPNQYQEMH